MSVWKVTPTDSNSILDEEAIDILKKLEDHKNRFEFEQYNVLLKKLRKKYPQYRSEILKLKIDTTGTKPKTLQEVMKLSLQEKKQEMRKSNPSTRGF